MTRPLKLAGTALGSVVAFAFFALAGWGIADLLSDDPVPEATVAALRYPLMPVGEDEEATLEWIGEEQDQTAVAMADNAAEDEPLGSSAAGAQAVRIAADSSFPPADVEDLEGSTDESGLATEAGLGDPAEHGIPVEVFGEAPYLRGRVDLTGIVIADPVGPVDIDICAGETRLPESPAGCPFGFGGTVVPLDGEITLAAVGGRPPTGFTAFGTDTLYVRAFRRSSVAEGISVKAVEWSDDWLRPEQGCDPGDGPAPTDRLTRPRDTIDIDTTSNPAGWPYDPDFDTLDVYGISLAEGTAYAICTYWTDVSGVGAVVSYWESTRVVTASARRVTVSVTAFDSFNLNLRSAPLDPVEMLTVQVSCDGHHSASFAWPGVGFVETIDPRAVLCDLDSVSAILQNGGIPFSMILQFEDGTPPAVSRAWLDIARSDITCRSDCSDGFVAGFALPDIEHELDDPGGTFAIPPTLYRAGRLSLFVEFDSPPDLSTRWDLGEPQSFDTSDRIVEQPPVLTRVAMGSRTTDARPEAAGAGFVTGRTFSIENEVPVSVRVRLLDAGFPTADGEPCIPGGGPAPSYASVGPSTSHGFAFEGLCLGKDYYLEVTAVDDSGVSYDVWTRTSAGAGANLFLFNTRLRTGPTFSNPGYTFDLRAELILAPLSEGGCYWLGDLELRDSHFGGVAAPIDNSRANPPAIVEWDTARWGQESLRPRYLGSPTTSPSPAITFFIMAAEAVELQNHISISIQQAPGSRGVCSRRGDYLADMGLSTDPTLTELLAGVTVTDGSEPYPQLRLWAESVSERRR